MIIEAWIVIGLFRLLKSGTDDFRREEEAEQIRSDQGRYAASVKEKPLTTKEKDANYLTNINNMGHPKTWL